MMILTIGIIFDIIYLFIILNTNSCTVSTSAFTISSSSSSSSSSSFNFGRSTNNNNRRRRNLKYQHFFINGRRKRSTRRNSKLQISTNDQLLFLPEEEEKEEEEEAKIDDDDDDDFEIIQKYTRLAIDERGMDIGLDALHKLAHLCQQRLPYNDGFSSSSSSTTTTTTSSKSDSSSVIAHLPKLFDKQKIEQILKLLQIIEMNGWLGTNPDSVDGLPSLHLNLISDGKPIVDTKTKTTNDDEDNDDDYDDDDFQSVIRNLLDVIIPPLHDVLLPEVNRLLNTKTSIAISEVFVRRYGQDICGGTVTRNGISAHYDVFSRVTSVIAMDDVAAKGTDGLYTTYISQASSSSTTTTSTTTTSSSCSSSQCGATSNHAALRRFFPLECGDGVVHTYDVLHGVDVRPGLDRTSLIVWFTDNNDGDNDDDDNKSNEHHPATDNSSSSSSSSSSRPTWLTDHPELETNDVVQFVLGSALSSLGEEEKAGTDQNKEQELYLSSAIQGNTFALTRMGSLFEEGAVTSTTIRQQAQAWIEQVQSSGLPDPIGNIPISSDEGLAMRYWFEGAIRGSPLAQRSLADELMFQSTSTAGSDDTTSREKIEDGRLLAAVLFTLAGQQGYQENLESLSRVIDLDLGSRGVATEEDFIASPVVITAQAGIL